MPPSATRPRAAIGIDHHLLAGSGGCTISCCVSLNDVTVRAAFILGLAILALIASGWRKTARAQTKLGRAPQSAATGLRHEPPRRLPIPVTEKPGTAYHAPGPLKRLWAVVASSGLTIVIGAVLATLIAFSLALVVTVLTDLLKQ